MWLLTPARGVVTPRYLGTFPKLSFVGAISQQTPCKCHHRRNSQADIFLQRFHLLGRCLPVSPVCSQSLHHEWKFDDTTGEECTKQEALTKKGTCSPIHSTLPMAESGKSIYALIGV